MKKLIAMCVGATLIATGSQAANLDAGTSSLGVAGYVDGTSADGTIVELGATYGYYVMDFLQLGVHGFIRDAESVSNWRVGGYAEYDIPLFPMEESLVLPYVGGKASYISADFADVEMTDEAFELGLYGGVKYFITDDLALFSQLELDWASKDVYVDEGDLKGNDWLISFGLKYLFDIFK